VSPHGSLKNRKRRITAGPKSDAFEISELIKVEILQYLKSQRKNQLKHVNCDRQYK
jgi:hypothetical protein